MSILNGNTFRVNPGQKVLITDEGGRDIVGGVTILINSEISLRISSTYGPVTNYQPPAVVTALTNSITFLRERGFTGSHSLQGAQIWQDTKPMEFSLPLEFHMLTSGVTDVVNPVKKIINKSVPKKASNKTGKETNRLIPPGPSLLKVLGLSEEDVDDKYLSTGDSLFNISIGNYLFIRGCVLTQAVPTFSKEVDSQEYPIWCKLDTTFTTFEVATTSMFTEQGKIG